MSADKSPAWADAPAVHVVAPLCPHCSSHRHITVRSEANGDGSTTRKTICADCSLRFKVVIEIFPE